MKDPIYIDGFNSALNAYEILDEFMRNRMNSGRSSSSYGWATSAEPLNEGYCTTTRVYPSAHTCDYGGSCSCSGKTSPKVRFDDILADVKHVIYNEPATIVTFSDGSKVCVKACANDTFNKETGLVYAIIKRLYADDVEEKTGYLRSSGLGEKISRIVKNAVDQKETVRERRKKHKQAKKDNEKKDNEKKDDVANEVSAQEAQEANKQA